MKKLFLLFILISTFFVSCIDSTPPVIMKPNGTPYLYKAVIINEKKGENWSENDIRMTSMVGCDSFQMKSPIEIDIWAEGVKQTIQANSMITVVSNP